MDKRQKRVIVGALILVWVILFFTVIHRVEEISAQEGQKLDALHREIDRQTIANQDLANQMDTVRKQNNMQADIIDAYSEQIKALQAQLAEAQNKVNF